MSDVLYFFFGNLLSLVLNLMIVAVFVIAAVTIFKQRRQLSIETDQFRLLSKFVSQENRNSISENFQNILKEVKLSSTIGQRLKHIYNVKSREGKINVDMISQINENIPLPDVFFAKNVAGSLILMGLMGTIIGLSVALGRMSSSVSEFELEALKGRLNGILSGMNTAFSTTITGLVLTLVLLYLIYEFSRIVNKLNKDIDNFLTTQLLPLLQPESEDVMQDLLQKVRENFQVTNRLTDKLLKATNNTTMQYDHLLNVANTFDRSTQNIISQTTGTENILQEVLGIAKGFSLIAGKIQENAKEFSSKYDDIMGRTQKVFEENEKQNISINKLLEFSSNGKEISNRLIKQIEMNSSDFSDTIDNLKMATTELTNNSRNTTSKLGELYKITFEKLGSSISENLDQQRDILLELSNNVGRTIEAIRQENAGIYQNFMGPLEKFSTELVKRVLGYQKKQSQFIEALQKELIGISKTIEENMLAKPLRDDLEKATKALLDSNDHIGSIRQELAQFVGIFRSVEHDKVADILERTITSMNELCYTIKRRSIFFRLKEFFAKYFGH